MSSFLEEVRRVLIKVLVPSGSIHTDSLSVAVLYEGREGKMRGPWSREGSVQSNFRKCRQTVWCVLALSVICLVLLEAFQELVCDCSRVILHQMTHEPSLCSPSIST